jgi:hypothetical protein
VAAVRPVEPDAGRHRADVRHRGHLQDEARALRLGHRPARGLAADLHNHGRLQKLFDADVKVSFLAHAAKFSDAIAAGTVLAPAKSVPSAAIWASRCG